jgi:hypothetical protein
MSNPTSNFGWQMPTNTDLVSQLPADFEVFGQAVDTSLADLKGGTTGQVLKKNTNADMDFVWATDAAGMTNPMTTTGDIIYSSSGSTPARLGIGTTGQALLVSGGVPAWGTPSASGTIKQIVTGSYNTQVTSTSDTLEDTGLSLSITPTSASSKIFVVIAQSFGWLWGNAAQSGAVAALFRNSTKINSDVTMTYANLSGVSSDFRITSRTGFWYVDSPATTSAVTYKTQFSKRNSGATAYANRDGESYITLMEIGA